MIQRLRSLFRVLIRRRDFEEGMFVPQNLLRGGKRNSHASKGGISHQTGQSSFKLAHVGFNSARYVLGYVIGKREAIVVGFLPRNSASTSSNTRTTSCAPACHGKKRPA